MSYIPSGAKWWLADIVLEIRVDGEAGSLVHYNLTLLRADSAEHAYSKALARGAESAGTYTNTDGKQVHVLFRGLRDLFVIYEDLEDGAELLYEEKVNLPETEILASIRQKDTLAVFAPST